jgi:hypothetical protein
MTTLEGAMAQVLAEMALLSYGSTTSWNASGGGDSPGMPSGDGHPLTEQWLDRWERDPTDQTVQAARADLDRVRRRQAPASTDGSTEEHWIIDDGEGFQVEQVARKFNTTPTRVRKLRMAHGRDTEMGLPKEFARVQAATPDRIRNLADRGCTERQIAFQVGVSKSTVRRALGRAA